MRLNAQIVDHYINILKGHDLSTMTLDEKSKERLIELFDVASVIAPMGDDDKKLFWIKVPRGPFREYVKRNFDYDDDFSDEEKREYFKEDYPEKYKWYELCLVRHNSVINDGEFYGLFMADEYIMSINDPNESGWPLDVSGFLEGLIEASKKVIELLEVGKYNNMIKRDLPFRCKYGRILRKDYYDIYPEIREEYKSGIGENELKDFLDYVSKNDAEKEPPFLLYKMTARMYYEACGIAYDATGYESRSHWRFNDSDEEHERYGGVTPKEKYYMYADGRDDGLMNVPMDDPEEFDLWLDEKGKYYEFNGHHPFEIRTAGSIRYSVHLFPYHKSGDTAGYYFCLSGDSYHSSFETIKMFNALVRAKLPVLFYNAKAVADRFMEKDDIGILPETIPSFYARYGNSHIGSDVMDFVNLSDGEKEQEVIAKVKWMDEPEVTLKE